MTDLVTYTRSGPISRIVMDDGKVNVMSIDMLEALHAAFDEAERDKQEKRVETNGCHFNRLIPTMKSG